MIKMTNIHFFHEQEHSLSMSASTCLCHIMTLDDLYYRGDPKTLVAEI